MAKEYLDITQQIEHLKAQGLNCSGVNARKYLNTIGYFKLINAYRAPFLTDDNSSGRRYIDGTKIQDIYALYFFDKSLRELLLSRLNIVEIDIKSKIITLISKKYGIKDDDWLKAENFRPDIPNSKEKSFIEIKSKILGDITKQKQQHPATKHFANTHNYYPFWVVSSISTFGTISQIYSKLKTEDQIEIARQYNLLPEILESMLILSVLYRNASAHHDVIYSYRAKDILAKGIKHIYERLAIPKNAYGKYIYGINDLCAVIIVFRIILQSEDLNSFFQQFNSILSRIKTKLPETIYTKIVKVMNLPENFNDIKNVETIK